MTTTATTSTHTDLIESKFNELAKKTLDELRQSSSYSRDFFHAVDTILNEPQQHNTRHGTKTRKPFMSQAASRRSKKLKESRGEEPTICAHDQAATEELKKQCDLLLERQRRQQEQLDNHQQILFDSQYRSLPAEITEAVAGHEERRTNQRAVSGLKKSSSTSKATTTSPSPNKLTTTTASDTSKTQTIATSKQNALGKQTIASKPASNVRLSRSKENLSSHSPSKQKPDLSKDPRQRSAIPQSTVLSGIQQNAPLTNGQSYPISKSATVGAPSEAASTVAAVAAGLGTSLVRQASLRINKQTRAAQQEFIKQQTRPLVASEKLRQRRPTRATITPDQLKKQHPADESDDDLYGDEDDDDDDDEDEDEDDDDEEFAYNNVASRRAYLNQRFINQQQQQQSAQISKPKTVSDATAPAVGEQQQVQRQQQLQVNPTITVAGSGRQSPVNTANMTVAMQRQRFSTGAPIVRSSTIGTGQVRPKVRQTMGAATSQQSHDQVSDNEQHEPRSLGGLLTSHDIGQLYKPHMNYSTSLLGNHRLSDDDEIIIIPTTQSPSLMSASVSPDHREHHQLDHDEQQHPDQSTNNMDEFSERFSISRTKSFWERLANSKSAPKGAGGQVPAPGNNQDSRQYNMNSSQRSIASGGPNLVADSKSSHSSLLNHMNNEQSSPTRLGEQQSGEMSHLHRYPGAMKSAFDRMDSTGGSGNSHYSGCSSSSSTSGDEQQAGKQRLSLGGGRRSGNRSMISTTSNGRPKQSAANPTISQLVQQDQLNRSDRFRQTR